MKYLALAFALALAGCSYASENACLQQHAACHVGAFDGNWHAGSGIPINSPAGVALLRSMQSVEVENPMAGAYQHYLERSALNRSFTCYHHGNYSTCN
jgi:hypothetical protein